MKQPIEFRTALLILFAVVIVVAGFFIYEFRYQTITNSFNTEPKNVLATSTAVTQASSTDLIYVPFCPKLLFDASGPSSSPSNIYSASLSVTSSGAVNMYYQLTITSLKNPSSSIYVAAPPVKVGEYHDGLGETVIPFIASYTWEGNTDLDIASYVIYALYDSQTQSLSYYRISPEELWQYDLTNNTYTFIDNLPEASSSLQCSNVVKID